MVSQINFNTINNSVYQRPKVSKRPVVTSKPAHSEIKELSFGGIGSYIASPILSMTVLNKLPDQASKDAYRAVYKATDAQGKADLKFLLDEGKLLANDADDATTTLYNIARIINEPRANGLDAKVVLNSTLRALANPYSITQDFGKLSPQVAASLMKNSNTNKMSQVVGLDSTQAKAVAFTAQNQVQPALPQEYDVKASGTCVAASMEFNLADKRPAEYARYAADLTSPKMAVEENFKFNDIDNDNLAAMYWLEQFNIEYTADDFEKGKVILRPDEAAIYRAVSQAQNRTEGTRSAVDVLMQSTFMQLGSARSYNTLTDIRTGGFNQSDRGLTEFEKSMAEAIVDDKGGKSSVTYQIVDDNAYLVGYNKDYQKTLMDMINSLKAGFNVIVGITETDSNAKITGGHEITIVGSKIGQDNKLYFICNDTDDGVNKPIEMAAEELIPKIHHAGIPNVILSKDQQTVQQKPIIIQIPPQINPAMTTVPVFNPGIIYNQTVQPGLNLVG